MIDTSAELKIWLDSAVVEQQDKNELKALINNKKEIEDRFYKKLEFGTAGLRGIIGLGTNRINKYVVSNATQGLADYLNNSNSEQAKSRGVAIAYDSRKQSDEFALQSALVLCANNIKVFLFKTMHSVPQLSFALRRLNCIAGIVITASHNPKEYNGYKVYGENGAQIGPEIAEEVTKCIDKLSSIDDYKIIKKEVAIEKGLLNYIDDSIDEQYYDYVLSLRVNKPKAIKDIKVVYSPLHGTGYQPVKTILKRLGVENLYIVKEQAEKDINFSTVSAPNPEAKDAFDYALKLAKKVDADICLLTDPDSDRLGVCVLNKGEKSILTGNQIACVLLEYILSNKKKNHELSDRSFVVKSIVSTNMANKIAAEYSVDIDETLTGFRYIGEKVDESVKNKDRDFVFGFEESFGFLSGDQVRDKDAILAAVLICDLVATLKEEKKTIIDYLDSLYVKYGFYSDKVDSIELQGKEGIEKIQKIMKNLRDNPPTEIAKEKVIAIRDYKTGKRICGNETQELGLPKSDVLYFELQNGFWICIRPSGTEPKLKIYINGALKEKNKTLECLKALKTGIKARIGGA